ncbi:nuclear factor of activated T-cells, cytoplasmic 4 isoform X2 [Mirounga angustirostris]|uniref:nuclear factor of activated T-cells, cytoplasmic 4 isoform X2 n=1 Tax=Mirounga angustirostris TaxID=9716 RepID=UPI001E68D396|nr:nuclear factor of activated T-cells, cytoplasmic 4 isoform X1 [Mirounga angustirostris]XP_054369633.1 nuclear factor of activated T-cells, cytoplasmic 4 isoform X1 [Mirounga angustirostris]
MHSPPPRPAPSPGTWESQPARSVRLGGPGGGSGGAGGGRVLECPSIRITSISPPPDPPAALEDNPDTWGDGSPRDYPPPEGFGGYRETGGQGGGPFFSPSPGSSSLSSWSFFSDASDEAALYAACDEVESELNEAASRFGLGSPLPSPRASPRPWTPDDPWNLYGPSPGGGRGPEDSWLLLSAPGPTPASPRPASPCGKRRYSSSGTPSSASPALSRRGSLGEEGPEPPPPPPLPLARDPGSPGPFDYVGAPPAESIPQKTRRTSSEQAVALPRSEEPAPCNGKLQAGAEETAAPPGGPRKEVAGMDYLAVPSPLAWSKARIGGHSPIFRTSALPPLDWPLPSQYEQLELRIEVQPRAHHRAHYETEGSRGAVKAAPGGHPVVKLLGYSEKPLTLQMFIGTADERNLRPHAFYQVHRITGKMVATASYEAVVSGTKVLEMTLLPENNMAANIDCAGILKLRNSDIELRKGETDIGRKNTRVRLVFRVHVPQGSGKVASVQTASVPIECSQRSAQELPQVEAYSPSACSVRGGEELVLTGSNFLPDSKVVFIERGPDGKLQWEEEATVNRLQSNEVTLTLTVPEYSNKRVSRPVQVYFYVSNGRRKRSPTQSFKFLPVIFKEEPLPDLSLRGFPSAPGPPFGTDMDFSPSRPPYPSYPHEDPAYETPYLSEGFSYGTPPLYPQTGPPPSYRPGLRMFPETGGASGCARPSPVSFLPRPFPSDPYGGRGSPFPLGLPFPPPTPFRPPLPSSPPLEVPFPPQSGVHPPPAEGYDEVGPSYGPGEGAPEQEKSRGGFGSGFRDSVPIQGITLEEGGCATGGCECECVCTRVCSACLLRAGVGLPRDGASLVPQGQSEGLRRQALGACGRLNPVKLSSEACMEYLPPPFCLCSLPQITKSQGWKNFQDHSA